MRRPAPRPARSATCTPLHGREEGRGARARADPRRSRPDRRDEGQGGLRPHCWPSSSARASAACSALFVATDAKQSDRDIVYLSQGGISLPDESYYRDPKFQPIREAFVAHVAKMFALAGRPEPAAAAKQVMDLETRLAKNHWDRVKSRDQTLTYNKKDRAALDALTPGFDWAAYFDARRRQGPRRGHRPAARLLRRDGRGATTTSRSIDWKTWLAWHVLIDRRRRYLNKPFVDEDFDFFAEALTGATELPAALEAGRRGSSRGRWARRPASSTSRKHFPPEAKARMKQLVDNLIEAYRQDIQELDWMSPETRKKALEKLAKFTPKIGYPDKWRDYSKLEIRRDDLVGNVRRADRLRGGPRPRQARQAGRPRRVGHDPADGQRLLQPAASTRSSSRPRSSSRRSSTWRPTTR